jgi:hypothetical protein
VLSFGAVAPGVPPQLASLYVPALGAAT